MPTKWGPDTPVESRLKDFGVTWRELVVSLDDIDWEDSKLNHARIETSPISDDLVTEYALAMERGDVFPKIVLLSRPKKKHFVLGGNHRGLAAQLAGDKTIPAYVVETSDEAIIDLLPRVLNRMHGRWLDRNEAIRQAMHAVEKYSFTFKRAAAMFGVSENTLANEARIDRAKKFLLERKINPVGIGRKALDQLELIKNDNVKEAVASQILAAFPKLQIVESDSIIRRVMEQRTELGMMGEIALIKAELLKTKGEDPGPVKKIVRPVRTKFLGTLRTMENYLEKRKTLKQLQITEPGEVAVIAKRLNKLAALLKALGRG